MSAQKWLSTYKGKPLPKGVRIRQGKGGALRLYVRCTNESGKQREIITPWHADDKDGIALAADRYHEIRLGIRQLRDANATSPAAAPRTTGKKDGSVGGVLSLEFEHWKTEHGRARSAADARAWETTALTIARLLGVNTPVVSLTRQDIIDFVERRVSEPVRGKVSCSYDTAMRNVQVLRSAIKRAQGKGYVPATWIIDWPTRKRFDAQAKKSIQEAHFIPREELHKFLEELDRDCKTGPAKSTYGRVINLLFRMSLFTGMRAGELERLRVRDVERHRIFIHPKYGNPAWFERYGSHPWAVAQKVIAIRGIGDQPDALLFGAGNSRELMYAHTQVARRASERLGLAVPIKLRDMRATSARWKYDGHKDGLGASTTAKDIEAARSWLRHADAAMTTRYLRVEKAIPSQADDNEFLP